MKASEKTNGAELGARIATLAAEMTVGEHALITAIGDFEESGQWAREGAVTCAHWLSWRIGMSPEAGRERVRVAKALRALPRVDAAFQAARLSYSKVRAVTRVATPANEALLVDLARASTAAQLESICRKFRGCLNEDAAEAEARRRMTVRTTERGTLRVSLELPADEGARFVAAVESGRAALTDDEERGAQATPHTRVDGLMTLVESWFASGPKPRRGGAPHEVILHVSAETLTGVSAETLTGVSAETWGEDSAETWGEDSPAPRTAVPAERHVGASAETENEAPAPRATPVAHAERHVGVSAETGNEASAPRATPVAHAERHVGVSAETGNEASAPRATPVAHAERHVGVSAETRRPATSAPLASPPFIDAAGGICVSAETARRLCCDASIAAVVEDGAGNVLDVGRKRRTVPAAMARALEAREGRRCSFPGCTHTLFVDKHHLKHWADGGATRLDNLCQLCRYHHTFVHEHGWDVERTSAGLKFITPRGRVVPAAPELPALTQGGLQVLAENAAVELGEVSLQTEGWGGPVDYVMVIDALLRETFVLRSTAPQPFGDRPSRVHAKP